MNNGQILLDLLNELNLYINTYLLNNNINNNNILYLLTNKILPRF